MIKPPQGLVDSMSDRTLEVFFQGMIDRTDPVTVMNSVGDIIKEELEKHGVPCTEVQVTEMAAMLGLQFLESIDAAMKEVKGPMFNEQDTVH